MTLSTRETDATFADLICDDPQWLDAEFDALISASFSEPPAPPPAGVFEFEVSCPVLHPLVRVLATVAGCCRAGCRPPRGG